MAWLYLMCAGLMEIGWPVGLKFAWSDGSLRGGPTLLAVVSIVSSGVFMMLAQRTIPMGTVYAVWTGIGTVGTFFVGLIFFKEPSEAARFVCVGLITAGTIGLKLVSPH